MTAALPAWLLEHIAADEAVARAGGADAMTGVFWKQLEPDAYDELQTLALRHSKYVLAVCEAHRRIVHFFDDQIRQAGVNADAEQIERSFDAGAAFVAHNALRALAAIYADRDGFREEWG